ncbi:hypothetical protein C9427_02000 [Mesorhizobium helmanticense]|uniref:Lipoprotein n=1 Tax=Mesorhizobium helmanticense TaxID=1776423 RepID=A0A2T4J3H3_9HYPH|nr:hypothetical protein C9427_02000 [Mesorhizobium helmanticense]
MLAIALAVEALLLLGGCNTTDPRQGGFFGGVGGIASGEYDRRIAERQDRLARMKQINCQLEKRCPPE